MGWRNRYGEALCGIAPAVGDRSFLAHPKVSTLSMIEFEAPTSHLFHQGRVEMITAPLG